MARDLAPAYDHCEALLRQADKDRWLAALFAPAERRRHLHALGAFSIEASRVKSRVKQPLAGELRLQWWRNVLEGEARGDVSANPVAAALLDTVERHGLSRGMLLDIVEAHRLALYDDTVASLAALEQAFDATIGGAIRLAVQVLAGPAPAPGAIVRHAASALGIADLIRGLPQRASDGFADIPADVLARQGAGRVDARAERLAEAVPAALDDLRRVARDHLAALGVLRDAVDERAAPAFLPVNLVEPFLRLSEKPGASSFAEPRSVPQWRRQWILWRAARRGGLL